MVFAGGRRQERLDKLVADAGSDKVRGVRTDVRSPAEVHHLVEVAMEERGRVDALVASAGVWASGGILDHDDDTLATMIDTNVAGTIWPIRAVLPGMLQAGQGDIVVIASMAGIGGGNGEVVYAATKSAQVGLVGALDQELAARGIRVSAVCPGTTGTELDQGSRRNPGGEPGSGWLAPLTPDDVAGVVLGLLRQPAHLRTRLLTLSGMERAG